MCFKFSDRMGRRFGAGLASVGLLLALGQPLPAQVPPRETSPSQTPPALGELAPMQELVRPPDDPRLTAAGALQLFMASRDYRKLRQIRSVMTAPLLKRFNYNSSTFNGKQGVRLAAFDFSERDLKPLSSNRGRRGRSGDVRVYAATVRSLWDDQGEIVEFRVESVQLERQEDDLWRVRRLERVSSESWRFREQVPGVTTVRRLLRAWDRGRLGAARRLMSPDFLRRYEGREEALRDLIIGPPDPRHTAFRVLEMEPGGETTVNATVQLLSASPGRPGPLDGETRTLNLVKRGSRWLLDRWD